MARSQLRHSLQSMFISGLAVGIMNLLAQIAFARILGVSIISEFAIIVVAVHIIIILTSFGFNHSVIGKGFTSGRFQNCLALTLLQIGFTALLFVVLTVALGFLYPSELYLLGPPAFLIVIGALSFPPAYAFNTEIVLMSEVLEHLREPKQSLSEVFRIMKPGGIFLLTTPFIYGMHEVPNDYIRYTEFGLNALLEEANLDIVRIQRRGELIGVTLSILGILIFGVVEFLRRNRILFFFGIVLAPVAKISERLVVALYMRLFKRRLSMFFTSPGNDLHGVMGQLSHWHLGYNVVCHKKHVEEVL